MSPETLESNARQAIEAIDNNWPVTMLESVFEIIGESIRDTVSGLDNDEIIGVLEMHRVETEIEPGHDYMSDLRESLCSLERACKEASGADEVTMHLILDGAVENVRRDVMALSKSDRKMLNLSTMVAKKNLIERLLDIADESGF